MSTPLEPRLSTAHISTPIIGVRSTHDVILEEALRLEARANMTRRLRYAGSQRKAPLAPTIIQYQGRAYTRKWLVKHGTPELRLAIARQVLRHEEEQEAIAQKRIAARRAKLAAMEGRP